MRTYLTYLVAVTACAVAAGWGQSYLFRGLEPRLWLRVAVACCLYLLALVLLLDLLNLLNWLRGHWE